MKTTEDKAMEEILKDKQRRLYDLKWFGGNREPALIRDNYTCQRCGITEEEYRKSSGKGLSVHHIDGKGRFAVVKNNALENLLTLCGRCHTIVDTERLTKEGRFRAGIPKTHCKRGHPLEGDNLFLDKNKHKECRICRRASAKNKFDLTKEPKPINRKGQAEKVIALKAQGLSNLEIAQSLGYRSVGAIWRYIKKSKEVLNG